jgi:outer membrane protein TolC
MIHLAKRFFWLLPMLAFSAGLAQNSLTLVQALSQAYSRGPLLQSAQATLQNATLQLNALKADPSTLIVALTQAEHNARLAQVNLEATRLSVMQSVVNAYIGLYEAQQNVALFQAQVALNQRNLEVARARQAAGNATALDVSRAQTTLDSARQSLTNAQSQLPVLAAQLATLLGLSDLGNQTIAAPPNPLPCRPTSRPCATVCSSASPACCKPNRPWNSPSSTSNWPTTTTPPPYSSTPPKPAWKTTCAPCKPPSKTPRPA